MACFDGFLLDRGFLRKRNCAAVRLLETFRTGTFHFTFLYWRETGLICVNKPAVRSCLLLLPMNSMRDPLNSDHHHLPGNKLHASTHYTALAMASSLQPLQRSADSKHRLDVHTVSDTSSPESVGKNRAGVQMFSVELWCQRCYLGTKQTTAHICQCRRS